jgi:hypothetical protein
MLLTTQFHLTLLEGSQSDRMHSKIISPLYGVGQGFEVLSTHHDHLS